MTAAALSWELKLAWQVAWQVRGCPPDAVLHAPEMSRELREHLNVCPFCSEQHGGERPHASWRNLAEHLTGQLKAAAAPEIAAGQIWSMQTSLAGWGPKQRYYNPPLVLVLDFPQQMEEAVQVAQVYDDRVLLGRGDIPVGDELFAEAWNTYTLGRDDLQVWIETVSDIDLDKVRRAAPTATPDLEESFSPLMAFRRLEIEVGAFFSAQAVERLLAARESDAAALIAQRYPDLSSLRGHLEKRHTSLTWPQHPHSSLENLALVRLPDHDLPLAAAQSENRITLNHVRVRGSELQLSALAAEITVWRTTGEQLLVGGQITGATGAEGTLCAWWVDAEEQLKAAAEVQFNSQSGFFRALFPGLRAEDMENGQLRLLLCETA